MRPTPAERRARVDRRYRSGSLGGRVENAQPVRPLPRGELVAGAIADEIPFSLSGTLSASTSPRWYAPRSLTLTKVFGSLGTAGTSTTTVRVKLNGTTTATLTFASGVQTASTTTFSTAAMVADTEYLTAVVETAGTSAADLDVQVRYA